MKIFLVWLQLRRHKLIDVNSAVITIQLVTAHFQISM